eukprot:SAG11_NODE_1455_length_4878_cov_3.119063_2_plen_132_part_00
MNVDCLDHREIETGVAIFKLDAPEPAPAPAPAPAPSAREQLVEKFIEAALRKKDSIVSGWQDTSTDIITLREELQSVQAELQMWIEMKAEAEASGGDVEYETTEVETLRAKVAQIEATFFTEFLVFFFKKK